MAEGPIDPKELNKGLYTEREWANFGLRLQWGVEDAQKQLETAKKSVRVPAIGAFVGSPVAVGSGILGEVFTDHFSWVGTIAAILGAILFFANFALYLGAKHQVGSIGPYEGSATQKLDHARRSYDAWLMADATHNEEFKPVGKLTQGPELEGLTQVIRSCKSCGDFTVGSTGWVRDWSKAHFNSAGHSNYEDRNQY